MAVVQRFLDSGFRRKDELGARDSRLRGNDELAQTREYFSPVYQGLGY